MLVHNQIALLAVAPTRFVCEGVEGRADSWASVSNYHYRRWQTAATLPEALKVKARALAQEAGTTSETIAAIYKYVQQNYISEEYYPMIGSFSPVSVRTMLTQKKKDIRSLHLLLAGMLQEVGVAAVPAVYRWNPDHAGLQPLMPSLYYNNILTYLPEQDRWLELHHAHKAAGDLTASAKSRNALLLRERGGELRKTPDLLPEDIPDNHRAIVRLRKNGKAQIDGQLAYGKRTERNLPWLSEEERLKKRLQSAIGLPGTFIARVRTTEDPNNASAKVEYRLTLKDWTRDSANCLLVPLRPLTAHLGTDRNYGYGFVTSHTAFEYRDTLLLQIPKGYRLFPPDELPRKFVAPMATFEWDVRQEGGQAILYRRLQRYPFRKKRTSLQAYRNFWQELQVLHGGSLVLIPEKS